MQQLRDLGINDEIIALQALEATDGDVQAAINIIFSDNNCPKVISNSNHLFNRNVFQSNFGFFFQTLNKKQSNNE